MTEQSSETSTRTERIVGWFRQPDTTQHPTALELASTIPEDGFNPETVREILDKCEKRRVELLDWSDRLDRKLLGVIAAIGVYAALLVSIPTPVPSPILWPTGLLALTSILSAYLGWRPHPFQSVPTDGLINGSQCDLPRLQQCLIAAHTAASRQITELNMWKAKKLTWATTCFMISAGTTIAYTILRRIPPCA